MRYRLVFIFLMIIVLMVGCSDEDGTISETRVKDLEDEVSLLNDSIMNDAKRIQKLEEEINELDANNQELEGMIAQQTEEEEYFVYSYYLAEQFIESYIDKDINSMRSLVSDEFTISNDYISYRYDDEEITYSLPDKGLTYRLNSYGYENENLSFQYRVYEEPSKGIVNGYFINLEISLINGQWQITNIEFDI